MNNFDKKTHECLDNFIISYIEDKFQVIFNRKYFFRFS